MPSPVPPPRAPVAVPPPLPVGSSATFSVGSRTHKHQFMQEKLEVANRCRAAMCKPGNSNPGGADPFTNTNSNTHTNSNTSSSSTNWN
jgi:hypothetical protein